MKHANPKSYLRGVERRVDILRGRLQLIGSFMSRRDCFDHICAWYRKYTQLLEVAQLHHRYDLGEPQPALVEATTDAERLAALWNQGNVLKDRASSNPKPHTYGAWIWDRLPLRVDVIHFRFGVAAILSLLVYDEMSPAILEVVPRMSDWTDAEEGFNYLNFPDAGLVEILRTGRRPRKWKAMLEFGTVLYGRSLLEETMECYADIILATKREDWKKVVEAVELAHELYEQRADNDKDYDDFEPWEGIGAGNALSIDLRLSALMRHCFRERPDLLDPLESIHRWKT